MVGPVNEPLLRVPAELFLFSSEPGPALAEEDRNNAILFARFLIRLPVFREKVPTLQHKIIQQFFERGVSGDVRATILFKLAFPGINLPWLQAPEVRERIYNCIINNNTIVDRLEGNLPLVLLLHPPSHEIPPEQLHKLFFVAVTGGFDAQVGEILNSGCVQDIPRGGRRGLGNALGEAASKGYLEIVQRILGFDRARAIPFKDETYGLDVALWSAAKNGHDQVVKAILQVFLDYPRVRDIISRDGFESALRGAAWGGHHQVVQMFLDYPHVRDIISRDGFESALRGAAWGGHHQVVQMFLDYPHVRDIISRDGFKSALWVAASKDHGEVMQAILNFPVVQADLPERLGIVLKGAAYGGQLASVQNILTSGRLDDIPEKGEYSFDKAFWAAAWVGNLKIATMILDAQIAKTNTISLGFRFSIGLKKMIAILVCFPFASVIHWKNQIAKIIEQIRHPRFADDA